MLQRICMLRCDCDGQGRAQKNRALVLNVSYLSRVWVRAREAQRKAGINLPGEGRKIALAVQQHPDAFKIAQGGGRRCVFLRNFPVSKPLWLRVQH